MVYMSGGKMARNQASIINRYNCGGVKKAGLGPSVGWFLSNNPQMRGTVNTLWINGLPPRCTINRTIQTQQYGYRATLGGV